MEAQRVNLKRVTGRKHSKKGRFNYYGRWPLSPEQIKLQLLIAHENKRLETLVDWAPERKRILAERAKRKKQLRLLDVPRKTEDSKADPTPQGKRELAWLTKVLALDRHPATRLVQPPKKLKSRRKQQKRKKLDAKNGKGKQKQNKHAEVQIAKGIAAVMAAAVVNVRSKLCECASSKHYETAHRPGHGQIASDSPKGR